MMPVNGFDLLSHCINGKLASLTPNDPECCIFRVHSQLRNINDKAYEPQLLAIGPYHRGKDGLRQMEEHKLRYLHLLLRRINENSVEAYISAMRELEGRARRCYAEPISLTTDEFVEMMLLDGCFIIELFRKFRRRYLIGDPCDPIFQLDWMCPMLLCDVLLFENQLPFFVLTKLFEMTAVPNQQGNLIDLALFFLEDSLPCERRSSESLQNSGHLLALAHKSITPPYVRINTHVNVIDVEEWNTIPSATEIKEAGVKFKKLEGVNLFDIKFNNGVMEIPPLQIDDGLESLFRNLIAYEQYSRNNNAKYFTEYMNFMDNLINSPKDVELLRRRGIIENWLGDDEAVSTMFNKLGDGVTVSNLSYAQIFRDVNKYCCRPWNVRKAKLRHNYFNSPWASISFFAAVFVILLALTQTTFSFLPYITPQK
ncbi:UPF0481 protein At3g47200-like [Corylus avellana]|uniref:UPF0481 protein At3g47200-like n=1 Tax=Corylus avellana TaxID=13451 RepID=UPI001E208FF7|nr:UPF0481 protein At3g47200-like [Corylus avellana]